MTTLIINGSGSLVFRGVAGASAIPGGTTGQIQYNAGGVFEGAPITTSPLGSLTSSADFLINGLTLGRGAGGDSESTVFGTSALNSGGGGSNTAIGRSALYSNTSGQFNVALGKEALYNNVNGTLNVSVGYASLHDNTSGGRNVAIGINTLYNNNGSYNIGIGDSTMDGLTSGQHNIAIGTVAGSYYGFTGAPVNNISNSSIFIGNDARPDANNQTNQIVIGSTARGSGSNTTVIGNSSTTLTRLFGSLALGVDSNYAATGIIRLPNNVFAYAKEAPPGSGDIRIIGIDSSNCVSIGPSAYPVKISTLGALTSSADVNVNGVTIGLGPGAALTVGNTIVGSGSYAENLSGNWNTTLGYYTLSKNVYGYGNVAVGSNALMSVVGNLISTTGYYNTAVGYNALKLTTGRENTAVGVDALNVTTGSCNTAIGKSAGETYSHGNNNVFIGYMSTAQAADQANQIVIGALATGSGSNTTTIGNITTTSTKLFGTLRTNGGIVGDAVPQGSVNGNAMQPLNDINVVPATSVYQNSSITLTSTGSLSSRWTVTVPAAADAAAYTKIIDNQTSGSYSAGITTGSGNVVDVASRQRELVLVDSRGVSKVTSGVNPQDMGLRLTATSGDPIPISDVSSSTFIYLTPHLSNRISLIYGGVWQGFDTEQVTLSLGTLTADKNYDVFAYWSGSAVVLELSTAWTNDTTRASALVRQNGVYVKGLDSTGLTRRYVGTIRTISTTQIADTTSKRFIWNYYNQIPRPLSVIDTTASWSYASPNGVWRQARASTTNQVELVCGVPVHTEFSAMSHAIVSSGTGGFSPGIGIDSTTVNSSQIRGAWAQITSVNINDALAFYRGYVTAGRHYIAWLETGQSTLTYTFYGNPIGGITQSGLTGFFNA